MFFHAILHYMLIFNNSNRRNKVKKKCTWQTSRPHEIEVRVSESSVFERKRNSVKIKINNSVRKKFY